MLCLSVRFAAGRSATAWLPADLQPDATAWPAPLVGGENRPAFGHHPAAPPSLAVSDRPFLRESVPPVPAKADLRPAAAARLDLDRPALRLTADFEKKTYRFQQRLRRRCFCILGWEVGCRRRFSAVRVERK